MTSNDAHNHEEEDFGAGDDDMRSIVTIIPHELERIKEDDENQNKKQEQLLEKAKKRRAW